jgi:hypothetical protein
VRNTEYLASWFVQSPDPTPESLIKGEQIVVSWHVPKHFEHKAVCQLELTYWDFTQEQVEFTLCDRLGSYCLENLGQSFQKNKGVIAYKATLKDPKGSIYQTWEHQLFTPLINISEDEVDLKEDPVIGDDDPWDWESSL